MARPEKVQVVNDLVESINQSKGIYLTDFSGLNVQEINELRKTFRESDVEYKVVKNTLARLSVQEAGYDNLLEYLTGPTAFAFSVDDPGIPARIIKEFAKKKDKPEIKAIVFEGTLLDASQAEQVANLPSREELIAKFLGTLNAPMYNLAGALQGLLRKFVGTLDAIKTQKEV